MLPSCVVFGRPSEVEGIRFPGLARTFHMMNKENNNNNNNNNKTITTKRQASIRAFHTWSLCEGCEVSGGGGGRGVTGVRGLVFCRPRRLL